MAQMTDTERELVPELIAAFTKMPLERRFYLLGLAQGFANNNLLSNADGKQH